MKHNVMQLLVSLQMGGAERLALSILHQGRDHFSGIIAGLFYPPGNLELASAELNIPSLALHAETRGRLRGIRDLYKEIKRHQVTLLHVQAAYLLPYAMPAAKMAGIPVVYTEHAVHSLKTIPWLRLVVRAAAPFLQGIVCVSESVAEYFSTVLGVKATVIRNGVDTIYFNPERKTASLPWEIPKNGDIFVFGQVARLVEAKDQQNLLRAFALVHQAYPQTRMLLVGQGEKHALLEALRTELGLGNAVHICSALLDIPERLRSMDVFVLSSKREGLPMAVLEAMACGIPVISTDVGAIRMLNTDSECVALVPPEDAAALAQCMVELLENKAERLRMARQGTILVQANFSAKTMAEAYARLYKKKEFK
ncbi:glycosyltransferase [Desulfosarcina sp. OttesenSCG-928-G10]|nr:glycosyltransferase [Desulfosarcina sp. OttesenSCG-928-G10]MDL2321194.1 glycosyltransferase [Desulfosarcina sp. OttesenSCG-928-B08]